MEHFYYKKDILYFNLLIQVFKNYIFVLFEPIYLFSFLKIGLLSLSKLFLQIYDNTHPLMY